MATRLAVLLLVLLLLLLTPARAERLLLAASIAALGWCPSLSLSLFAPASLGLSLDPYVG
jgi:hypothetical protein